MSTTIDETVLKNALKAALVEVLQENRGLLGDLIEEALEEIALTRAIEEGLTTESVTKHELMSVLEGAQ
ncbi:MAG TPA: hypothetical protein VGN86_15275 [Pyrinomonadaceae bacterium]|jgi:hypothetical protein|nr:hypothetical protein [Pyrinomonadaceae bacterium]